MAKAAVVVAAAAAVDAAASTAGMLPALAWRGVAPHIKQPGSEASLPGRSRQPRSQADSRGGEHGASAWPVLTCGISRQALLRQLAGAGSRAGRWWGHEPVSLSLS